MHKEHVMGNNIKCPNTLYYNTVLKIIFYPGVTCYFLLYDLCSVEWYVTNHTQERCFVNKLPAGAHLSKKIETREVTL